ncbi:MAG: hypothetical protein U1F09_11210 [Steroidobacteraceae bacterium]
MNAVVSPGLRPDEVADLVTDADVQRLLGVPPGCELPEAVAAGAAAARRWYAVHGRPWIAARRHAVLSIDADSVTLDLEGRVPGARLAARLARNDAHALVAVAVSAGREVADEAARLWSGDRPDESYFLDRFATAVVETLLWRASAILCGAAIDEGEWLIPHLSPGCGGWEIEAQRPLFELAGGIATAAAGSPGEPGATVAMLGPVELLDTGSLRPQHSVLAALGVSRRAIVATPEGACRSCDRPRCRYRRVPRTRRAEEP